MTNEKAIEKLKYDKAKNQVKGQMDEYWQAFDMAIKALEKQIPKKPRFLAYDGNSKIGNNHCPKCDSIIFQNLSTRKVDFCIRCGQAIDWSEE